MFKSKTYKVNTSKFHSDDLPALGVPKVEFMKTSSFNFLENERLHNAFERLALQDAVSDNDAAVLSDTKNGVKEDNTVLYKETQQNYTTESNLLSEVDKNKYNKFSVSRSRVDTGYYAPKRYLTTCYFAPKQYPVNFSETCIITIGSKKKQYYETIQYQTRLLPEYWSEEMNALIKEPKFTSEKVINIANPTYHYISLEPQQLAATMENNLITEKV